MTDAPLPPRFRPIEPPPGVLPRYSSRPFPAYRFVPGLHPHPIADLGGHSYRGGAPEPPPARLPPAEQWRESSDYLYGADLYNHAYWWEAHEAWEALWRQAEQGSLQNHFLQGLIQIAAAHLKRHLQRPVGVHRLVARGLTNLWLVQRLQKPERILMGVDISAFVDVAEQYFDGRSPTYPLLRLGGEASNLLTQGGDLI